MCAECISFVYRGKEAGRMVGVDPQACTVGDVVATACAATHVDPRLVKLVGLWKTPRPPAASTTLAQLRPPVRWKRPALKVLVFGLTAEAYALAKEQEHVVSVC